MSRLVERAAKLSSTEETTPGPRWSVEGGAVMLGTQLR